MKLLGYNINDFTHPVIIGLRVCSDMRKEIEMWLKNPKLYNLKECSNDRDTRHVLGIFQDLQEQTGVTNIQTIEYLYSLEQQIEDLKQTLEDTQNHMEWVD